MKRALASSWAVLLFAAVFPGCGSDNAEDCDVVCQKNADCRADSPGKEACVDQCKALSAKDSAYAEAIKNEAECYADVSCDDVRSGKCDAAGL